MSSIPTSGRPAAGFPTLRTPAGPVPADAPAWNPQRASAMPSHRYRSAYLLSAVNRARAEG